MLANPCRVLFSLSTLVHASGPRIKHRPITRFTVSTLATSSTELPWVPLIFRLPRHQAQWYRRPSILQYQHAHPFQRIPLDKKSKQAAPDTLARFIAVLPDMALTIMLGCMEPSTPPRRSYSGSIHSALEGIARTPISQMCAGLPIRV